MTESLTGGWIALGRETVGGLPDRPGVFVLGTMVRSVLLVGVAEERGLRATVAEAIARGPLATRARCIRIELRDDPRPRQAELVEEYRASHAGALPPEQPPVRNLQLAPRKTPSKTRPDPFASQDLVSQHPARTGVASG